MTQDEIKAQISKLEQLLEEQPKMVEGKWNHKYFSLSGKITKLKKELSKTKDASEGWLKFLSK
jgi:hypothetical protein